MGRRSALPRRRCSSLTHHAREPLELEGGTTFHFVTDGIESAVRQARAAAGEQDVLVAGGGAAVQQCLAAGLLDEIQVHVAPVLLGSGVRLFEDASPAGFEVTRVVAGPVATHIRYRLVRRANPIRPRSGSPSGGANRGR